MYLEEHEIIIPLSYSNESLLIYFERAIRDHLPDGYTPIRFIITKTDKEGYRCELGVLAGANEVPEEQPIPIFKFLSRQWENTDQFNAVLLVPTGIGAEIGGHAGDACPVARLLASACDTLITHPNVVNASDINELPENGLYVEGSVISRLLMGTIGLQKVRSNRVLLLIDEHNDSQISAFAINAASAARAVFGMNCVRILKMDPPIKMEARYSSSGSAVGQVFDLEKLCRLINRYREEFDAVAIASVIGIQQDLLEKYFHSSGEIVNPWGGVEALLTHAISMIFNVPSAHAPMVESLEVLNIPLGVVDPRMSAEAISCAFLHCVLKGLHRSPKIVDNPDMFIRSGVISAADVSCLIIPDGCVGLPTLAAMEQGIPVIAVRENRNLMRNNLEALPFAPGKLVIVDNYLEAAGVMMALKSGVSLPSVRRPLEDTVVSTEHIENETGTNSFREDSSNSSIGNPQS